MGKTVIFSKLSKNFNNLYFEPCLHKQPQMWACAKYNVWTHLWLLLLDIFKDLRAWRSERMSTITGNQEQAWAYSVSIKFEIISRESFFPLTNTINSSHCSTMLSAGIILMTWRRKIKMFLFLFLCITWVLRPLVESWIPKDSEKHNVYLFRKLRTVTSTRATIIVTNFEHRTNT